MTTALLRALAVAAFALAFSSCATADPELLTPDGRPLAEEPAARYRIAVTPVGFPKAVEAAMTESGDDELQFTIPIIDLQNRLVEEMVELNAATEVFAAVDREEAVARGADVVIQPTLRQAPDMAHNSLSGRWLLSGVLWLTTWIGGMAVDDSTYDAKIALDCDLMTAARHRDERPIAFTANSGLVDLGFWDRNDALSLNFFATFILPPFWTGDNPEITSESLSDRAVAQLGGRVTNFLKFDLIGREKDAFGQIIFDAPTPANGAAVGDSVRIAGRVVAREPIFEIRLERNGETYETLGPNELPPGAEQQDRSEFQVSFSRTIKGLRHGANTIRMVVKVRDWYTSRTFTVYRGVIADSTD